MDELVYIGESMITGSYMYTASYFDEDLMVIFSLCCHCSKLQIKPKVFMRREFTFPMLESFQMANYHIQ